VQQLTPMDYMFVQQESQRTPMHISPVIIYDPSGPERGKAGRSPADGSPAVRSPVRFKEILTTFERNLHKSAIFRRKLLSRTMGFDTPYWIEDDNFDLEFHVRHIALPKPGDWRQLCILLARLHSRGLDMRRPLWEAWVIEGLNNVKGLPEGSFAIMLKIHHSAIDGVSGAEIITAIHSLTPELAPPLLDDPWRPEKPPTDLHMWSQAMSNSMKLPGKFFETVGELIPAVVNANKVDRDKPESKAPRLRTRFNARTSAHRVTNALRMDLQDIKDIRHAVEGATINDVIVCIVGGCMRKYLAAHDELPAESLTCGAPINVRAADDKQSTGNQLGVMAISLATDVKDPVERLRAVHQSAVGGKEYSAALGSGAMMDITESLAPRVLGLGMQAAMATALGTAMQLPIQTMVSNVPGPQQPLYLAGARVYSMMGMGPVLDNMGLFHGVISGAGFISINFTACRDMLPDPEFYLACMKEAFEELKAMALS
jgi:diacylglycerol O-acyltransferase